MGSGYIHPTNGHPKDQPDSGVWPSRFWLLRKTRVSASFSPLHSEFEVIPTGLTNEHLHAMYWELKPSVKLDFCNAFVREKTDCCLCLFFFFNLE